MRSQRKRIQRYRGRDGLAFWVGRGVMTLLLCIAIGCGACAPTTSIIRTPTADATATAEARGLTVFAASGAIFALRASDGKLRWQYTAQGNLRRPAVVDGVLYTAIPSTSGNFVVAIDEGDRAERWQTAVSHPVADAPRVVDGTVYVSLTASNKDSTPFGAVYALRASDGMQLWCHRTGDPIVTSPVIANGVVYVNSYNGTISALRADQGTLLWRFRAVNLGAPVVAEGLVLAVAYQGSLYALRASDGQRVWRYGSSGDTGAFAVAGGVVYMTGVDASVSAIRVRDGSVVWHTHVNERLAFPVIAGELIVAGAANGDVVALRAGDGSPVWRSAVGPSTTVSAVVGDVAYGYTTIPGPLDLYPSADVFAIDVRDGSRLWTYHLQSPPSSGLTVAE